MEMTTSKKPFMQTNCDGADEKQERETVDSLTVTFSPGSPMEMVRFLINNQIQGEHFYQGVHTSFLTRKVGALPFDFALTSTTPRKTRVIVTMLL